MGRGLHRQTGERVKSDPVNNFYYSPEWNALWRQVIHRDRWVCQYCGERATQADHITPRSKGGADALDNLVACCKACNQLAGNKAFDSLAAKQRYLRATRKWSRCADGVDSAG